MPSTYTNDLRLELQATGENSATWGAKLNSTIQQIEDAIAGMTSIATTGGSTTLTTVDGGTDESRYAILKFTGVLVSDATITVPSVSKTYIVWNATTGSYKLQVKTSGGTGPYIMQGSSAFLFCDGTDVLVADKANVDSTFRLYDETDPTKVLAFQLSGITTGQTRTITAPDGNTALPIASYTYTISGPSAARTWTVPDANFSVARTDAAQTFTGAQLVQAAATQDGIELAGRAGGSSSYKVTLTPTTLTASRTVTAPDADTKLPICSYHFTVSGPTAARTWTAPDGNIAFLNSAYGHTISGPTAARTWTAPDGNISFLNSAYSHVLSGPTAVRTLTLPDENFSVGYRNIPAVGTKTGSYSLATTDVGKYVQLGAGGAITIPDATFSEGDVITIFNNGAGTKTITCTITTAYIAGTDADKATMTLAARGVATILFISGTICVVSGNVS